MPTISELKFPHSIKENLLLREDIILKCDTDLLLREKIKEVCRRDPIFFINGFCFTKNPSKPFPKIPFIVYDDFQDDSIREICEAIERGHDLGIEKTREMGVSWMIIYCFTWFWLFYENCDFRVGSRKEDFVDKIGDMDTLIEKVRFCLRYLPSWMLPKGYDESTHATYMKIINPENKNTIIGESANPHFGSGGRRKALLMDEFAKWDDSVAEAAWTSTHDVTHCRIVVSTPVGSANKFAQLMNGTKEKIKKLTLHWTLHPEKARDCYYLDGAGTKILLQDHKTAFKIWNENRQQKGAIIVRSPWYDVECERRSDSDVAQELDIDYIRSGFPYFAIVSVKRQRIWAPYTRRNPFSRIPFGRYIQGHITHFDNKFLFKDGGEEPWLNIFEEPEGHMEYVVGGDTSEGLSKGDESFLVIRSKYTRNVVATCSGLYQPDVFARYVYLASKLYNDALVAIENAVFGYAVNRDLETMGSHLYYTKKYETKDGGEEDTPKRGFTTSEKTRPLMLSKAEEEIRKQACDVRDPKIIQQMQTFIKNPKKGGRPEADGSMHDDGVIAFSIAGFVITENPYVPRTENLIAFKQREISEKIRNRKNAGFGY